MNLKKGALGGEAGCGVSEKERAFHQRTGELSKTSHFRAGKPGALLRSVYPYSREKTAFFTILHRFEDLEDLWREKSLYVTAFAPK